MSQWGAENFRVTGLNFGNIWSLESVCRALPVTAKKAFYAAASARTIKRGTWNGCAFNAGGVEIGKNNIKSATAAAEAFGCTVAVVSQFIRVWDQVKGTDDEATALLRDSLEKVGLFQKPGSEVRIISYTAWKSEQTELLEAFQKQLEEEDYIPAGFDEACNILAGV